jgi:hypothetical protein
MALFDRSVSWVTGPLARFMVPFSSLIGFMSILTAALRSACVISHDDIMGDGAGKGSVTRLD